MRNMGTYTARRVVKYRVALARKAKKALPKLKRRRKQKRRTRVEKRARIKRRQMLRPKKVSVLNVRVRYRRLRAKNR